MFFRRPRKLLEPGAWGAAQGRPRVLVENPDAAERAAYADILRAAGYEVATCSGPSSVPGERSCCPLVEGAGCPLVEGTDVVVSTSALVGSRDVLTAIRVRDSEQPIVFEVPAPTAAAYAGVTDGATLLHSPVTEGRLRQAVADALAPPPT